MNLGHALEIGLGILGGLIGYDLIIWICNFIRKNIKIAKVEDPNGKDEHDQPDQTRVGSILY